jgi:hypothetical protein
MALPPTLLVKRTRAAARRSNSVVREVNVHLGLVL